MFKHVNAITVHVTEKFSKGQKKFISSLLSASIFIIKGHNSNQTLSIHSEFKIIQNG